MDSQGGEIAIDADNWRTQLQPDSRLRIVNKIMQTLKRHIPFSGQEGLEELKIVAVRIEEPIYTSATSLSDYLRKISLKMLRMETKSQNTMSNSLQASSASNSNNQLDPVRVLDRREQVLRAKTIPLVKVLWRHQKATWEHEATVRVNYPQLFDAPGAVVRH